MARTPENSQYGREGAENRPPTKRLPRTGRPDSRLERNSLDQSSPGGNPRIEAPQGEKGGVLSNDEAALPTPHERPSQILGRLLKPEWRDYLQDLENLDKESLAALGYESVTQLLLVEILSNATEELP